LELYIFCKMRTEARKAERKKKASTAKKAPGTAGKSHPPIMSSSMLGILDAGMMNVVRYAWPRITHAIIITQIPFIILRFLSEVGGAQNTFLRFQPGEKQMNIFPSVLFSLMSAVSFSA
jgi:hypothetical protein